LLNPPPLRGAEDGVDGGGLEELAAEKKAEAPPTKRATSNPFSPPRRRAMNRSAPIDHRGNVRPQTVTVPAQIGASPEEPAVAVVEGVVEDALPWRCICPFTMTILLMGCDIVLVRTRQVAFVHQFVVLARDANY